MNQETLLYTHSDEAYGHFVIPFMYFALVTNPNYFVEVWACDYERHVKNVNRLNSLFGDRALILTTTTKRPDVSRFRFPPKTRTPYTYISDVDIITLDQHIMEWHVANLDGKCFSNAIRPLQVNEPLPRLSGLMFVITNEWYEATADARLREYNGNDEMVLAQIAFNTFPDTQSKFKSTEWNRPIHGIHMSPRRNPYSCPGWEVTNRWLHKLKTIEKHKTWPEFWSMTDEKWKQEYNRIKLRK